MAKIAEFLAAVSEDPNRLRKFKENPKQELDASGLDAEQRALVESGDTKRIRQAIKRESPGSIVVFWEA
jgi:hypothetical protein